MEAINDALISRLRWLLFAVMLGLAPLAQADQLTELLTGTASEAPSTTDKVITTDSSNQSDAKIRTRLREIFAELDSLNGIGIAVNKGVITLTGEVDSSKTETKALQLASQVEGVVEVENELTVNRSLQLRLKNTTDKLWALTKQTASSLPLFLIAVLVLVTFWLGGRWVSNRQFYKHITPNHFIANLLGQITHLIFIVFGIVLALVLLDATALIGTILGAAGIVGLAVGFAVRDTVENYIASILLSLRNPFQVNDFVSIDGNQGNVLRLTSRATILISPDGNHIRIPNSTVFKAVITNFTRHEERRFQFDVGIDTEQDLLEAQVLAMKALKATEGVLDDPKPLVVIQELGDSNVIIRIYAWVNQVQYSYAKVRSETIRAVKQAYDEASIVMPDPTYNLRLMQADGPMGNLVNAASAASADSGKQGQSIIEPIEQPKTVTTPVVDADDIRDVQDVTPDRTVENKVIEEQAKENHEGEGENLLNEEAKKE